MKKKTIPMPTTWQTDFRSTTMRTNFMLTLTQPMIEYLSATADNVRWDRTDFNSLYRPDNWIATEQALEKRGLVVRKSPEEIAAAAGGRLNQFCRYHLTPAGAAVVALLKVTGIFVEADAAIENRTRRAAR